MSNINPKHLDPGIRSTVAKLRAWGFETTDSGDGVSKCAAGMVLPFPHVFMVVEPEVMIAEAHRLRECVEAEGVSLGGSGPGDALIEATYNPSDGVAVLALLRVTL